MARVRTPGRPSLTLVRRIKAPPAKVFAAFVEPEKILRWWGPDAGPTLSAETDVRPGGRFRVVFRTLDGEEHENRGAYLEVVPDEKLVFTWEWASMDEPESRVTVLIEARNGGSELTVIHEHFFDEAMRDSHRWGWSDTLEKLETLLA
jgi:uncharacterized protein YndB with AHSA1/START domain